MDQTASGTVAPPLAGELPERGPALIRPLRVRDFRLIFGGETISVLGDQFHFVALAWLALQLTGSGLALGTVLMTAAIPRAIFVLVGGAFSDRFSPRTLMLVSNAIRGIVVAVVAALVLTDNAELWHLYVLAAVFGIVDAFFYPALNTIVPMVVPGRLLAPANAVIQGSAQIMGLIGPALAGTFIALLETGPAFVIDAASFGVAALAVFLVRGGRRPTSPPTGPRETVFASIGAGLRAAWADPAVRSTVVLVAAVNLAFTGPTSVGLAWLADNRFEGGSAAFGFLFAAWGGGALIGAVIGGSVARVPRFGTVMLVIACLIGVGFAFIGIAPNVPVALAIIGPMAVLIGFINVQYIAWLQRRVPEELRGRIMSLVMLGSIGLAPVSLAIAGALVDLGLATFMYAAAGAIVVAAALVGFAWGVPAHMDREPEPAA
ncbi:MAG TPA: MFS transporter [Candidatus Limnocylindria bacterium]|nr:MFS transporter [Candidatus Limnocylindria bacterium]